MNRWQVIGPVGIHEGGDGSTSSAVGDAPGGQAILSLAWMGLYYLGSGQGVRNISKC